MNINDKVILSAATGQIGKSVSSIEKVSYPNYGGRLGDIDFYVAYTEGDHHVLIGKEGRLELPKPEDFQINGDAISTIHAHKIIETAHIQRVKRGDI